MCAGSFEKVGLFFIKFIFRYKQRNEIYFKTYFHDMFFRTINLLCFFKLFRYLNE